MQSGTKTETREEKDGRNLEDDPRHEASQKLRGRKATSAREIPGKGWKEVLKRTKGAMDSDNMGVIAAGVAFYLLLSIIPALVALISIYGLIADPVQVQQQFEAVSGVLPTAVHDLLTQQMERIASNNTAAGWGAAIGILVALWGASSAIKVLARALNIAYDSQEKRSFIKLTGTTLLLTLGAVITGIVAIGAIVLLPIIFNMVGIGASPLIINLIRWPLLAALAIIGFSVLYRFAPDRPKAKWKWITSGSVLAMVLWVLGSAAFSFYVSNFGKYNETYGSLAAIVIMLLWLFLSAYVVLMGAELNSEIEKQTASIKTDRPHEPVIQRGGHATDELGESYA